MRTLFVTLALLLAIGGAAADQDAQSLVLVDGSTLAVVRAELREGMVWVTTDKGVMQAYPVEEVDLGASGLLAEPAATPTEADAPRTKLGAPPKLQDATAQGPGSSAMRITDADVEHVTPEELEAPDSAGDGTSKAVDQGPFPLSDLRHKRLGERINVTGTVTNNSEEQVDSLTVNVAAKDAEGVTLGQGSTVIRRTLGPGGSSPFSLVILGVTGQVQTVDGMARPGGGPRGVPALEVSRPSEGSRTE